MNTKIETTKANSLLQNEKSIAIKIENLVKSTNPAYSCVYVPDIKPVFEVENIFILMEPTIRGWAMNEDDARYKVKNGFRSYIYNPIFLYSILKFLRNSTYIDSLSKIAYPNFYITDISKVALKVEVADRFRFRIYDDWQSQIIEEIKHYSSKKAEIYFVGKKPYDYLINSNYFNNQTSQYEKRYILHYSNQAGNKRKEWRTKNENEYADFCDTNIPKKEKIKQCILDNIKYLNDYVEKPIIKAVQDDVSKTCEKLILSESQKELMYSYYKEFSRKT